MPFANALWNYMATINIEVAYARPDCQKIIALVVEEGCTIEAAILQSGILEIFPEIDLKKQNIGVFSKPRKLNDIVKANDRIEIYRPLAIDPKEQRRKRTKRMQIDRSKRNI